MINQLRKTFELREETDEPVVTTIAVYAHSINGAPTVVDSFWNVIDLLPEDFVIATLEGGIHDLIERKTLPERSYSWEYRKYENPDTRPSTEGYHIKVLVDRNYLDRKEMNLINRFELKARLCDYLFLLEARKEVLQAIAHWKEDWPDERVIEVIKSQWLNE